MNEAVGFADIQRVLALFAEGIAGRPLHLKPLDEKSANSYISRIATDGLSVHIPSAIADFALARHNQGAYRIIVLHQIGYLVNGTFDFDLRLAAPRMRLPASLAPTTATGAKIKGSVPLRKVPGLTHTFAAHRTGSDLERFFAAGKRPALLRRVFVTLEDLRIDCALARDYPGASADLARVLAHALAPRPSIGALRPLPALIEGLVQYSLAADRAALIQLDTTGLIPRILDIADTLKADRSNVYDSARAALDVCALFEALIRKLRARNQEPGADTDDELSQSESLSTLQTFNESESLGEAPRGGAEQADDDRGGDGDNEAEADGDVEPSDHEIDGLGVGFRGELMPNLVHQRMGAGRSGGLRPLEQSVTLQDDPSAGDESGDEDDQPGRRANGSRAHATRKAKPDGPRSFLYDEWDYHGGRYQRAYCRLYEQRLRGDDQAFIGEVRRRHALLATQVKRQFSAIKPESWQRVHRTPDGDELGLDSLIEAVIDRRAGHATDEHLYVRRDRALREVAAAFLVDMSASTDFPVVDPELAARAKAASASATVSGPSSTNLTPAGKTASNGGPYLYGGYDDLLDTTPQDPKRRVIDVAKEALALMCDALHTLGDSHAVYGFSGEGRDNVEFYVAKEFSDKLSARTWGALAAIQPRRSTRMGPAIRHAVTKLARQPMRLKVLIIVSDGYPQDSDYGPDRGDDEYGIQDTARALQEAERSGVSTFCITIDPAGHDYLRRMCAEHRYMVIDDVASLPQALSKVYQALTG